MLLMSYFKILHIKKICSNLLLFIELYDRIAIDNSILKG